MSTTRRLAAILAADVAGYSRLMAANEVGALDALNTFVDPAIVHFMRTTSRVNQAVEQPP